MSQEFDNLRLKFERVQKCYREAKTHDEKVQLVMIAKELAIESRRQIAESKRVFALGRRASV